MRNTNRWKTQGLRGAAGNAFIATLVAISVWPLTACAADVAAVAAVDVADSVTAPQVAPATIPELTILSPLDVHPRTSLTIVEQLRHNHYLKKPLDDQISSQIFENYLNMLDGAKMYFLAEDVQALEKHRYHLDDALIRGNLDPAFEIFNIYQARLRNRLEFLLAELDKGLASIDFDLADSVEIDRENSPWPADEAAIDDLWRKRLKASALSMKLNGKPLDEIEKLLTKRYRNRLKQTNQTKSEDAFQLYVNAFARTYDPHTQYFSPRTSQNFNINMSLSLEGIGAVLRNEDEYTSVVELVPAGPADKSGLIKPADRIVSVGQGDTGPLIDVVGWRLDDVVELIRGPKGSLVRLEIIPGAAEDETSKVIQITRNTVKLEEQAAKKQILELTRNGQSHKIGIIEVPTFYVDFKAIQQGDPNYKSTTRDVHRLIDELVAEGIDGLIMDLRNNGGGSLQEADTLTGLFIKSGPTVQVKSASRRANIYSDTDDVAAWDGPLAVMVNRLSASASEIFAGAIQDYERGIIIGSQTFGKGTVQTLVPLNRGQLKITAAKFYRVSGQSTQHQGILPDIEYPEIYDTERIGESSLDDAMPWDTIQPAVYPRTNRIQPILGELQDRHRRRVFDDPDFVYLRELVEKNKEHARRSHVSLNEGEREAEKEQEDKWRLELENTLRVAKGEPPVESLDALDELRDAASNDDDDEEEDPAKDALKVETGNILLDYIGLTRQIALVENLPNASETLIQ
ncbi:MAG: carboxy terminal-processing peptidase [Gammaproteobacteria bacterium]|nr:carboxy terminal-processing peptidase [Gammaproteobacteria bacterium]